VSNSNTPDNSTPFEEPVASEQLAPSTPLTNGAAPNAIPGNTTLVDGPVVKPQTPELEEPSVNTPAPNNTTSNGAPNNSPALDGTLVIPAPEDPALNASVPNTATPNVTPGNSTPAEEPLSDPLVPEEPPTNAPPPSSAALNASSGNSSLLREPVAEPQVPAQPTPSTPVSDKAPRNATPGNNIPVVEPELEPQPPVVNDVAAPAMAPDEGATGSMPVNSTPAAGLVNQPPPINTAVIGDGGVNVLPVTTSSNPPANASGSISSVSPDTPAHGDGSESVTMPPPDVTPLLEDTSPLPTLAVSPTPSMFTPNDADVAIPTLPLAEESPSPTPSSILPSPSPSPRPVNGVFGASAPVAAGQADRDVVHAVAVTSA
jgi:hypothetical protein